MERFRQQWLKEALEQHAYPETDTVLNLSVWDQVQGVADFELNVYLSLCSELGVEHHALG